MIDKTNIPRFAIFRGRRVRVINYRTEDSRPFEILDTDDTRRWVSREQLQFVGGGK